MKQKKKVAVKSQKVFVFVKRFISFEPKIDNVSLIYEDGSPTKYETHRFAFSKSDRDIYNFRDFWSYAGFIFYF